MKPWFVKEADIIKFPEPEKKVIELPNVQSYPDFLTGVKDLHNRKAQGEISQDSHDRLYSDLINRFMKKESFETPWFLREQKGKCNRGHAMELHIAIAIYMRLQSKNDIDINSLKNKIISLSTSTKIKEETTIKGDTYILEASVTSDVINCSRQPKIYEPGGLFRPNIERALAVANQQVKKQIEFIHNNQRKDKVEIKAIGTQGGKVDLAVAVKFKENGEIITQRLSDLTFSLKVKNKEFGQKKINSPLVLLRGFTNMFTDLGFPKTFDRVGKPIIEKLLKNKRYMKLFDEFVKIGRPRHDLKLGTGPEGSEMAIELNSIVKPVMQNLYKSMAVEMTKQFKRKGGEQKEFEVLANFLLNELADGGDMSVLQFNEKSYTILTASKLKELKKFVKDNLELEVRFSIGKGGVDPYFNFVNAVDNEILFQIRFTADGKHVMKNPYQQGPGLEKYKTKFDY
jgi:hypothetical protein